MSAKPLHPVQNFKIVPFKNEFCHVLTSIHPDWIGFVEERTSNQLTIKWKDGTVGKYNIEENQFTRINVWWGPEGEKYTPEEKITVCEELNEDIRTAKCTHDSLPPETKQPKMNVRDFVKSLENKNEV